MANIENVHKGHRQRLLDKYLQNGINSLEDHEVLEILLFFALSRCNTNDISHKLINRFGSISGVINAPIDEIMEIDGVGQSSAVLLRFLGDFVDNYKVNNNYTCQLNSQEKIIEFCKNSFINNEKESFHLLFLDKRKYLVSHISLTDCKLNSVIVDLKSILMKAFNTNAGSIIFVHNHPNAPAIASENDINTTRNIMDLFSKVDINIIDHIIIGNDGYHSMRKSGTLPELWK